MPSGNSTRAQAPRAVQQVAHRVRNAVLHVRNLGNRAVSGDKPLAVGFLAVFVAAVVLLSGPMTHYLAARDRVDLLEAQSAALAEANTALEQRRDDLNDPDQLELRAREDGFIRPGEVPYVVVPPKVERPQIVETVPDASPRDAPWFVRIWRSMTSVFGQ